MSISTGGGYLSMTQGNCRLFIAFPTSKSTVGTAEVNISMNNMVPFHSLHQLHKIKTENWKISQTLRHGHASNKVRPFWHSYCTPLCLQCLAFASCVIQTPPLMLQVGHFAPCLAQTPPFRAPFVNASWLQVALILCASCHSQTLPLMA